MVVGVHGEHVAKLAVLEVRQELVQIHRQEMEELNVLDLQVKIVTLKHVLVMSITIIISVNAAKILTLFLACGWADINIAQFNWVYF